MHICCHKLSISRYVYDAMARFLVNLCDIISTPSLFRPDYRAGLGVEVHLLDMSSRCGSSHFSFSLSAGKRGRSEEGAPLSNRRPGEVVERPSFPGVGGWEKARQITPGLIRQCAINFGLHADSYYFIHLLLPSSVSPPLASGSIVPPFQPPAASLCHVHGGPRDRDRERYNSIHASLLNCGGSPFLELCQAGSLI